MKCNLTPVLVASCIVALSYGCIGQQERRVSSAPQVTPPAEGALFGELVPVLLVTVTATAQGYGAESVIRSGVPTSAIHQDRDVAIVARDAAGKQIASLSIENPRLVRTTGSSNPATDTRDTGTATVALPNPAQIRTIEITVRRGPNEGLREQFAVSDGVIRRAK